MKKVRIIERKGPNGHSEFVIQQKHFLFRWLWVDAWINSSFGADCQDYFNAIEEAKKNICYFDGSECSEKVVFEN